MLAEKEVNWTYLNQLDARNLSVVYVLQISEERSLYNPWHFQTTAHLHASKCFNSTRKCNVHFNGHYTFEWSYAKERWALRFSRVFKLWIRSDQLDQPFCPKGLSMLCPKRESQDQLIIAIQNSPWLARVCFIFASIVQGCSHINNNIKVREVHIKSAVNSQPRRRTSPHSIAEIQEGSLWKKKC
jgi:hypothetical protein